MAPGIGSRVLVMDSGPGFWSRVLVQGRIQGPIQGCEWILSCGAGFGYRGGSCVRVQGSDAVFRRSQVLDQGAGTQIQQCVLGK